MKKLLFITVLCAFVAAPAFADHTGTATFHGVSPSTAWHGVYAGQYNVKTWGLGVVQGDGVQFGTFCIEWNEHITTGVTYGADLSYAAIKGGEAISDPLDADSAYLYDAYLAGSLSSYNAWDVQIAIWSIENELPDPTWVTANATALKTLAAGQWSDTGLYRVMNLYNPNDTNAQDFIIKVPVPGAVLLGMLGLSVAGVKLRKYA